MTQDEETVLVESLYLMLDEVKAMSDALAFICMTISKINPKHAAALKQTFENLSTQKQFKTTKSFSALSKHLARALARDMDTPLLSMEKSRQHAPGPQELRNLLQVLRGGKA